MIRQRLVALTGVLILTALSIAGCKSIKKEAGASATAESVENKATETASEEEPEAGMGEISSGKEPEAGMGNPWVEITEEEANKYCPRLFKAPEGAKAQEWLKCEELGDPEKGTQPMIQLSFELDDLNFTARAQYGASEDADISGIYTEWTVGPEDATLAKWGGGHMSGKTYRAINDSGYIDLITWYDVEIGIKYSLSTAAEDLAGFDIQAVAEQMYSEENEPYTGAEEDGEDTSKKQITEEEALSAIRNYCYANNADLKEIEEKGEYPVFWEIESNDGKEIVVLFRSYTGAEIRYHIDAMTGDTYVTEFVPGVTSEEERTEESFNIR